MTIMVRVFVLAVMIVGGFSSTVLADEVVKGELNTIYNLGADSEGRSTLDASVVIKYSKPQVLGYEIPVNNEGHTLNTKVLAVKSSEGVDVEYELSNEGLLTTKTSSDSFTIRYLQRDVTIYAANPGENRFTVSLPGGSVAGVFDFETTINLGKNIAPTFNREGACDRIANERVDCNAYNDGTGVELSGKGFAVKDSSRASLSFTAGTFRGYQSAFDLQNKYTFAMAVGLAAVVALGAWLVVYKLRDRR